MEREAQPAPIEFNQALHDELCALRETDLQETLSKEPDIQTVLEHYRERTQRLKEIIRIYGWPTISLVGEDGAYAAYIIAQHSTADLSFQQEALRLMETAASQGEARLRDVAYLTDRIRVMTGQTQLFGTQWGYLDASGNEGPYPIEDPEHLDERRAKYNLGPIDESNAIMEKSIQEREGQQEASH